MTRNPAKRWLDSGWGCQASNRDQLLRTIGRVSTLARGRVYAWRGQSSASWDLSSSLYRHLRTRTRESPTEADLAATEQRILREARNYGLGRDLGSSNTDAHLLASLQHHGIPTRLIDMTSNPYTALWFACQEAPDDAVGASVLFAIDVTEFAWAHSFDHQMLATWDDRGDPMGASYSRLKALSRKRSRPFRLYPAVPDDRMRAQEGYFIGSAVPAYPRIQLAPDLEFGAIKPPGAEMLDRLVNEPDRGVGRPGNLPFLAVVIDKRVKASMRDPLKGTFNRRRRVLFPDLDGFRDAFRYGELDLETPAPGESDGPGEA